METEEPGIKWNIRASYCEIYNEQVPVLFMLTRQLPPHSDLEGR
jgi:hypothetical protein